MHRPYVGVTGFTTTVQVESALSEWRRCAASHALMCGFLADRMLLQESSSSPRNVARIETLVSLFASAAAEGFPVLHYAMFECADAFAEDLLRVLERLAAEGVPLAVQLNGTPDARELAKLRLAFPAITLILQIRPSLLEQGPLTVAQTIMNYGLDTFSHALIDPSCGMGRPIVIADAVPFYDAIRKALPDIGIGFAGGFDGSNAALRIQEIAAAIGSTDFSIDAEGGLFTREVLDGEKVARYVRAAAGGFASA